jgi:hypothetical protein
MVDNPTCLNTGLCHILHNRTFRLKIPHDYQSKINSRLFIMIPPPPLQRSVDIRRTVVLYHGASLPISSPRAITECMGVGSRYPIDILSCYVQIGRVFVLKTSFSGLKSALSADLGSLNSWCVDAFLIFRPFACDSSFFGLVWFNPAQLDVARPEPVFLLRYRSGKLTRVTQSTLTAFYLSWPSRPFKVLTCHQ